MQGLRHAAGPAEELAGDYRWFPEDFRASRQVLSFVFADRDILTMQPFLDNRWNTQALPQRHATLESLARLIPVQGRAQANFIWHTSFCCSTLLVRSLNIPGKCLALSEPMVLVSIADAKRAAAMEQGWRISRLPDVVFRLLSRPECEGGAVVLKPSNFANILLSDAARLTAGKFLFLYSDLPGFLISVFKRGVSLRKYVRRLFSSLVYQLKDQLPWSQAEIFQMSDLEIAALCWHYQIQEFRAAWPLLEPGRRASLDCEEFLARPVEVLERLAAFYGVEAVRFSDVVNGPLFRHHAKDPAEPFDAARRAEEAAAMRRQLGKDLDRIIEWSYRACPTTPACAPLSGALAG